MFKIPVGCIIHGLAALEIDVVFSVIGRSCRSFGSIGPSARDSYKIAASGASYSAEILSIKVNKASFATYEVIKTGLPGRQIYQNYLGVVLRREMNRKAIELFQRILTNGATRQDRSTIKCRTIRINDEDGTAIEGRHFINYNPIGDIATYFIGNRNLPGFIRNMLIPRIAQIPEVLSLTHSKPVNWSFTFNASPIGDNLRSWQFHMPGTFTLKREITPEDDVLPVFIGNEESEFQMSVLTHCFEVQQMRVYGLVYTSIVREQKMLDLIFGKRKYYGFTEEEKHLVDQHQDQMFLTEAICLPNTGAEQQDRTLTLVFGPREYSEFTEEEKHIFDQDRARMLKDKDGFVLSDVDLELEQKACSLIWGERTFSQFTEEEKSIANQYRDEFPNTRNVKEIQKARRLIFGHKKFSDVTAEEKPIFRRPGDVYLKLTDEQKCIADHYVSFLDRGFIALEKALTHEQHAMDLILGKRKYHDFSQEEKRIVDDFQDQMDQIAGSMTLPNTGADQDQKAFDLFYGNQKYSEFTKEEKALIRRYPQFTRANLVLPKTGSRYARDIVFGGKDYFELTKEELDIVHQYQKAFDQIWDWLIYPKLGLPSERKATELIFGEKKYSRFTEKERRIVDGHQKKMGDQFIFRNTRKREARDLIFGEREYSEFTVEEKWIVDEHQSHVGRKIIFRRTAIGQELQKAYELRLRGKEHPEFSKEEKRIADKWFGILAARIL